MLDARSRISSPGIASKLEELRASGHSLQSVANELSRLFGPPKFSKSTVQRYVDRHEKEYINTGRSRARRQRPKRNESNVSGRCPTCNFVTDAPTPEALLKRAEWAVHVGEEIVVRARADDDTRLALQGLDRIHRSLELTMKAVGMIGSADAVVVNVDQRRIEIANEAARSLPTPVLRLVALAPSDAEIDAVIDTIASTRGTLALQVLGDPESPQT